MANNLRASWGIDISKNRNVANVQGVVSDWSETVDPVQSPLQNEKGSDIGHTIYDIHRSATVSITCKKESRLPDVGEVITIDGRRWYVQNASITENNQSYMKFSASLERWENNPVADKDIKIG